MLTQNVCFVTFCLEENFYRWRFFVKECKILANLEQIDQYLVPLGLGEKAGVLSVKALTQRATAEGNT